MSAGEERSPFEVIGAELGRLVTEKDRAYGSAVAKSGDFMRVLYPRGVEPAHLGDLAAVVRIVDKLFRIATAPGAFGEDPWADIAGYALVKVEQGRRARVTFAQSVSDVSPRIEVTIARADLAAPAVPGSTGSVTPGQEQSVSEGPCAICQKPVTYPMVAIGDGPLTGWAAPNGRVVSSGDVAHDECYWRARAEKAEAEVERVRGLKTEAPTSVFETKPMWCPHCGAPHADEGEWATRVHRTHLCAACGGEWRVEPAVCGAVQALPPPYWRDRLEAAERERDEHKRLRMLDEQSAREASKLFEQRVKEAKEQRNQAIADASGQRAEVARVRALIDRDRTGLAHALDQVLRVVRGYGWIQAGEWGPYADEERTAETMRREASTALEEIGRLARSALEESGRRANAAFHPPLGGVSRAEAEGRLAEVGGEFRVEAEPVEEVIRERAQRARELLSSWADGGKPLEATRDWLKAVGSSAATRETRALRELARRLSDPTLWEWERKTGGSFGPCWGGAWTMLGLAIKQALEVLHTDAPALDLQALVEELVEKVRLRSEAVPRKKALLDLQATLKEQGDALVRSGDYAKAQRERADALEAKLRDVERSAGGLTVSKDEAVQLLAGPTFTCRACRMPLGDHRQQDLERCIRALARPGGPRGLGQQGGQAGGNVNAALAEANAAADRRQPAPRGPEGAVLFSGAARDDGRRLIGYVHAAEDARDGMRVVLRESLPADADLRDRLGGGIVTTLGSDQWRVVGWEDGPPRAALVLSGLPRIHIGYALWLEP